MVGIEKEILNQLGKLDKKLDENTQMTHENSRDIRLIKQCLQGNGGKGLFQRMDESESWQKEHVTKTEERSRLSREEVRVQRTREATIMAAIIAGVTAIVTTLLRLVL